MLVAGLMQHAADPFGKKEKALLYFDTLPAGWIWKIWLGFGGSQMSNRWKFG